MADTSTLSLAQITTLAATEPDRTVVPAKVQRIRRRDTSFRFYVSDIVGQGARAEIRNGDFFEDVILSEVCGPAAGNALTNAEKNTLLALLDKLHVARVMP
jgi:hypothetical protein